VAAGLLIAVVWHSARAATVQLAGDGVCHATEFLLLLIEVLGRGRSGVLFEPVLSFLDGFEDLFHTLVMCLLI